MGSKIFHSSKQKDVKENWIINALMVFSIYSIAAFYYGALDIRIFMYLMLYIEAIICIPLLFYSKSHFGIFFKEKTRLWAFIGILGYMIFESMNTLMTSSVHDSIIRELVFWIFFVAIFFIGNSELYWSKFLKTAVLILLITSALSLYELMFSNFVYLRGQWDDNSYLYGIQVGFEPLVLLLCYYILTFKKNRMLALLVISIFVFFVVLQFIFQKRLPLVRCVMILAMLYYTMRERLKGSRALTISILLIMILFVGYKYLVPQEYAVATSERFTNEGSLSNTINNDNRYLIVEKALAETFDSPWRALFGRGVGGIALGNYYSKTVEINGVERPGLSTFEVGAAYIIFRYGLVFFFIMYGTIFKLLLRYKKYKNDPLALSCWMYLSIFFFMTIIGESFPSVRGVLSVMLLAAAMGYLSSFNRRTSLQTV